MATYYNPKIVTNNIEFSVDAANPKSWSGSIPGGTPYGYFGGGRTSPYHSTVDRVDYSSDTPTASPKGPLTGNRAFFAATGNNSYGYWGGGFVPGSSSYVDRVDYASDTPTASPKGPLSGNKSGSAAAGTNDFGYFAGGWSPGPSGPYQYKLTTIDRIDYSNDTATAVEKGPLSSGRYYVSGAGNASYGYFAGGYTGSATVSTMDRLDYSSDTTAAAEKGPLREGRSSMGAAGNGSFGYWCGGNAKTIVDRLDYSSDTTAAAAKGPLSQARSNIGGTGNASYGWFGGGESPSRSTIDRIDYSSDTPTASVRGPLSYARQGVGAASGQTNGLPTFEWSCKDITGKGHDIDISTANSENAPTFSGVNGGAWNFDGTNDYISLDATTDIQAQAVDWTWECWFYVDAGASSYDYLFAYGPPHQIAWYDNQLNAWFNDTDNTSSYDVSFASGSNTVPTGQWTHGVISRIGSAWKMYINGVEKASASASFTVANSSTAPKIGSYDGSQYFLDGKIASMRIYKGKGFTASEVLNNFNATRTRFGV